MGHWVAQTGDVVDDATNVSDRKQHEFDLSVYNNHKNKLYIVYTRCLCRISYDAVAIAELIAHRFVLTKHSAIADKPCVSACV